jgi:glutamate-1-semialdehyde 2,1-aminomutase
MTTFGIPELLDEVVAAYQAKSPVSARLFPRFKAALAGGETRSILYHAPYPLVIQRGVGAELIDVDGNTYIDALNNYTSLVHGNAYGPIVEAVVRAMESTGSAHAGLHSSQVELAELLQDRFPAAERIRFTNSGSEATILAMRIARAATGRRRYVAFLGGYHGSVPEFIDGDPQVIRVPFNDIEALANAVDEDTAAVFAEPFLGSGGVIGADAGFLEAAGAIAHDHGALFILDEVQSLRNAFSGVHGELRLDVDLVTMGKIIGGGLPVGAVAGSAGLMTMTAAAAGGPVIHSGTFNGNVATMVAGLASMQALNATRIERMNKAAVMLAARIESVGEALNLPLTVTRAGSIMQVHFRSAAPRNVAEAREPRLDWVRALHLALLVEGVYTAPRGMLNLSTAMMDDDLDAIGNAYDRALRRIDSGLSRHG